MVIARATKSQ